MPGCFEMGPILYFGSFDTRYMPGRWPVRYAIIFTLKNSPPRRQGRKGFNFFALRRPAAAKRLKLFNPRSTGQMTGLGSETHPNIHDLPFFRAD
jgi:hypothetical protein